MAIPSKAYRVLHQYAYNIYARWARGIASRGSVSDSGDLLRYANGQIHVYIKTDIQTSSRGEVKKLG